MTVRRLPIAAILGACALACGGSEFSGGADLHDLADSGSGSAGTYSQDGGGTGGVTPASGSGGTHAAAGGAGRAVTGGHSAVGGTVNESGGSPAAGGGVGTGGSVGHADGGAPPASGGSSGSGGALATGGAPAATGGAGGAGGQEPAWLHACGPSITCQDPVTCPLGGVCCIGPDPGYYTGCGCLVLNPLPGAATVCR
jgi:hypothetical protein